MTAFIAFLSLAFTPGIFWLWQIQLRNRHRPDPQHLIIRTFFLGAIIAVPMAMLIEEFVAAPIDMDDRAPTIAAAAYGAFIVAGVTEELIKFLIVRYSVFRSPYFDEPMSGLVFGSAAALGFASLENAAYMLRYGVAIIAVRGVVSTLGHVVFSCFWGYALGLRKARLASGRGGGAIWIAISLLVAAGMHGLFDFFLMEKRDEEWKAYLVFAGGLVVFMALVRLAGRVSPFRQMSSVATVRCRRCACVNVDAATFCTACGAAIIRQSADMRSCGNCQHSLHTEAMFCTVCGHRALKEQASN